MDKYILSNLTPDDLQLFVSRRYLDETSRVALEKITSLKGEIADIGSEMQELDSEATEIEKDQARLRENIKALGQTAEARQLIARYVAKANEQETRIEQLSSERRTKKEARLLLQLQLETAIRALTLDRKL
jgi:septal ring factor EnvC (AmiA/AmiB activator)